MYSSTINDEKVQQLDENCFKFWVNLLCLASQNDGTLPPLHDISFATRSRPSTAIRMIEKLKDAALLDEVDGKLEPHNWASRQFKIDTSNERVKRYRQRHSDVTAAVTVTAPDTDTAAQILLNYPSLGDS